MKLGLCVSLLGGCMPPFGHSRKEMAVTAALIGAGTAIAGNVATNVANAGNVRDTNATNYRIAVLNNMAQQQQLEQNLAWLREQFYKQRVFSLEDRKHNDIGAVVNRALAAGINPAAVVGNGQSQGQNVSSVGAPSPTVLQAPHIEPVTYDFNGLSEGVGRAVDAYYENRLKQSQNEGVQYDNQIKSAQASVAFWKEIQAIRNVMADTDEKLSRLPKNSAEYQKALREKDMIERELFERIDSYQERRRQLEQGNKLMERQERHIGFEEDLAVSELAIKRALAASEVTLNGKQMSLISGQLGLIAQQTQTEFERGRNISADTLSKRIENTLRGLIRDEKVFEADKKNSSKFLKNLSSFSHYLGDLMFSQLKGLF